MGWSPKPRTFQGRIQLALVLVAAVPLGVGVLLAGLMLDTALSADPARQVESALAGSVEAHRAMFLARRESDELRADLLASSPILAAGAPSAAAVEAVLAEACEADPDLRALRAAWPDARTVSVSCDRPKEVAVRENVLSRPLPGEGELVLTFGLDEAAYVSLQEAGAAVRALEATPGDRGTRLTAYWAAFGVLFGGAVLVAWLFGAGFARRAARRIEHLVAATGRVRAGELDVEVPVEGEDELSELAAAFNTMVTELRERGQRIVYLEKISSWQEIARRLAHEIKNPLTPIQLSVQQLAGAYRGDDPRYRRLLDEVGGIVREEVETLRRLVSEFSEFAKLPAVSPEPTDLVEWVRGFVRQNPNLSQDAAIDLEAPEGPIWARVDRGLMRRVLTNLIHNAIQAAEGEGLIPKVHLAVREGPVFAHLVVADEGPGISPDLADRIFDPYFTTKDTGTGLGLAICKKIVLQHEGRIRLEAAPGGGARFDIRLPRCPPAGPAT